MEFSAEDYLAVAREHLDLALLLHAERESSFRVAEHYLSGLAVECLLRAYLRRATPTFESRHDLMDLARQSGFGGLYPLKSASRYHVAMMEVGRRWRNNHRYCSEEKLRVYLRKAGLHVGVKGDILKHDCGRMIAAASELIQLGESKWKR